MHAKDRLGVSLFDFDARPLQNKRFCRIDECPDDLVFLVPVNPQIRFNAIQNAYNTSLLCKRQFAVYSCGTVKRFNIKSCNCFDIVRIANK